MGCFDCYLLISNSITKHSKKENMKTKVVLCKSLVIFLLIPTGKFLNSYYVLCFFKSKVFHCKHFCDFHNILLLVLGLECYVCKDQDGNTDKCLRTIRTCEHEHDRCLSIIRWSTTPYWSQVRDIRRLHLGFCPSHCDSQCERQSR